MPLILTLFAHFSSACSTPALTLIIRSSKGLIRRARNIFITEAT